MPVPRGQWPVTIYGQPLQLITSAHDVLATMPLTEKQEKELAQAAGAVAQLAEMLGQLVEAVQLYERGHDDLAAPVLLRPILDGLIPEFEATARLKESTSGSRVRGTPYFTPYCPPVYSETLSVMPS